MNIKFVSLVLLQFLAIASAERTARGIDITIGDEVTLTWKSNQGIFTDWVGLFRSGAPDSDYLERYFVSGTQTLTFSPPEVGIYDVRYFQWSWLPGKTYYTINVMERTTPPTLLIKRTGRTVARISWPTRTDRAYDLFVGQIPGILEPQTIRAGNSGIVWDLMTTIAGNGGTVSVPIFMGGQGIFRVRER